MGAGTAVVLVEVPDVLGETQAAGTTELETALFVVSVTTAYSPSVAAGLIISQDPEGGEFAAEGSTVAIVVSLGPSSGAGRPKRKKRYLVSIDGQDFEVDSPAEAVQRLEQALALAQEVVAPQAVERSVKRIRRGKKAAVPALPVLTSSPEIASTVDEYRVRIEAIYRQIAIDAELRELMRLKMLDIDDEEAIFVLLH